MENFRFKVATNVLFGKGQIEQLPTELAKLGKSVLLVYGGGSIQKSGLYDTIKKLLVDFNVFELAGVDPNPRITSVQEGATLCKEHGIDIVLGVGGGSVIDCSKAIAAAACYDGDPWDLVLDNKLVTAVLPIATVLTLAATGTEMNRGAVISNMETNQKLAFTSEYMLPTVSILDPTYTYTVSPFQTAAGSADILSHLIENYFKEDNGAYVQDKMAEALMKTVITYTPLAIENPTNYEARANLMWASSLALNGLTGSGKVGNWSCHGMEHELSAFYDVTHGAGLAVLTPRWMEYVLNADNVAKYVDYALNVWDLPASLDPYETAYDGINATFEYFKTCGLPMTLPELDIDASKFEEMAEAAIQHGGFDKTFVPLDKESIMEIYENCMD